MSTAITTYGRNAHEYSPFLPENIYFTVLLSIVILGNFFDLSI
ncbi:hypothetical protein DOT_5282 [Desulfosporosinus sp. OT]|nr:hypothetical protein DOT_5282 [Desulfosporosinus sp. OT]